MVKPILAGRALRVVAVVEPAGHLIMREYELLFNSQKSCASDIPVAGNVRLK
jgi:hypothetical protein